MFSRFQVQIEAKAAFTSASAHIKHMEADLSSRLHHLKKEIFNTRAVYVFKPLQMKQSSSQILWIQTKGQSVSPINKYRNIYTPEAAESQMDL